MKRSRRRSRCCPNPDCSLRGQAGKGNIIRHSFYITSQGRRRRYRCKEYGRTFSSTQGTPYYRLHKPRSLFDEVVRMCVHGMGISAMARIKRMAWGTVARWLESAATCATRFNDRMLKGFVIRELQADEIRTFVGTKKRVSWVLTTLEVWSRLWISVEIGRRNFRNIKRVLLDTLVVVHYLNNLNIIGIPGVPAEAIPPLFVDSDAVLTFSVSREGFQETLSDDSRSPPPRSGFRCRLPQNKQIGLFD